MEMYLVVIQMSPGPVMQEREDMHPQRSKMNPF